MPGRLVAVALLCVASVACASLEGLRALVHAPRFEQVEERTGEIRLSGPSFGSPAGGASVRL